MSPDASPVDTALLQAVTEAMTEFLRSGEPRAASGRVLRAALEQTDSEYGFAGIYDGRSLRILNHAGVIWDGRINRTFYDEAVQRYEEIGYLEFTNLDNLFGHVLTSGTPVVANAPGSDPRSGGLPAGHPPLNSFLGVPLLSAGRVVGILGVANRSGGYGAAEQQRLEVLAQTAGVMYDAYGRRQRESELESQIQQMQKLEATGRLAAGVAHDFNNLLVVITGLSELVLTRIANLPEVVADVENIRKAGQRAAKLTQQLLAFSRRQTLAPEILDLNHVVRSFETILSRVVRENIRFEVATAPSVKRIKADPAQIEQLLTNLVINARDAMPDGGTLTLATADTVMDDAFVEQHMGAVAGSYVSLTVRDTGGGMPRDVLARVFEPFFTTKPHGQGTGLGLSMVYGLVKQSGGYVTVESEPGAGTTVTTYWPTLEELLETAAAGPRATRTLDGTETILLVEDEREVRRLMQRVLESHGYTVLEAANAGEALTIEAEYAGTIHMLLTDVIMPKLSGPTLAQRIVQRRPAIKVIFVSGHVGEADLGAAGRNAILLRKPFAPDALAARVRDILD